MSLNDIHSLRKRGNSYLIVVSMGYDCAGNRFKSMQQTVHPPAGMTPKQTENWLNEQAVLFELSCKQKPATESCIMRWRYKDNTRTSRLSRAGVVRLTGFEPATFRVGV